MPRIQPRTEPWRALPSHEWQDTMEPLHLWTQIVGKIRMAYTPWINHSWSVPRYVSSTGLRTSLIPRGSEGVELAFDFIDHQLMITTTTGRRHLIVLESMTVADFYAAVLDGMARVELPVQINAMPNEIPDAIPFDQDTVHRTYVREHVVALWKALVRAQHVMTEFRAGFHGKASPVHFFWGSFDLATTRFSGRPAPPHPGGMPNFPDAVVREAYSDEETSVGFWPGNRAAPDPIFYAYAYPTPQGFSSATVAPAAARWLDELGEFALPYDVLTAVADLAQWDRVALECQDPLGPEWWKRRNREPKT